MSLYVRMCISRAWCHHYQWGTSTLAVRHFNVACHLHDHYQWWFTIKCQRDESKVYGFDTVQWRGGGIVTQLKHLSYFQMKWKIPNKNLFHMGGILPTKFLERHNSWSESSSSSSTKFGKFSWNLKGNLVKITNFQNRLSVSGDMTMSGKKPLKNRGKIRFKCP